MISISVKELNLPARDYPRPPELRQPDYENLFESEIFAYDVFWRNGRIFLICPPISDNIHDKYESKIKISNNTLAKTDHKIYIDKIQKIIIRSDSSVISINEKELLIERVPDKYQGRNKVLYTLQKNNPTKWINQWIDWYKHEHDIDTVIIYDNASTEYSTKTLAREIQRSDLEVIVEDCPYKYGPGAHNGSKWDSDFLQYAMFERVRYKDCNPDSKIINADIDEIIVCKNHKNIFSHIPNDASACIFPGRWIEVSEKINPNEATQIIHDSHSLVDISTYCANKWAVNLANLSDSVFLRVHDFAGPIEKSLAEDEVIYLHYRQINTNWKYNRKKYISNNSKNHIEVKNPYEYFSQGK